MTHFSQETIEAIGSYVYTLLDPRKPENDPRRLFYVGKGTGQRCFAHARAEIGWDRRNEPNPKLNLVREIRKATGAPPPIQVIAHGLTEETSHQLEAALISVLQTDGNLASGRYAADFSLAVEEIEGRYRNPLKMEEIEDCVLLVSLNGGEDLAAFPEIAARDLPGRTLRYWVLAAKVADKVDYVAGVYKQLIRCIFTVGRRADGRALYHRRDVGVKKNGQRKIKTEFEGERCPTLEEQWCNRRIVNEAGETLTKFRWGVGTNLINLR